MKQIWASPVVQTVVKANPNKVLDQLMTQSMAFGIPPETIDTFTLCFPKLKGPGDEQAVAIAITLNKPYDAKKVIAAIHKMGDDGKFPTDFNTKNFTQVRENVFAITSERNKKNEQTLFHFDNPNRVVILGHGRHEFMKPVAEKQGPIAEAITTAKTTTGFSFGLNWANLPDEIRQDMNLPPQVEPFKPLIMSDALLANGSLTANEFSVLVRVMCGNRAKALEAEKSLGVLHVLLQTVLNAGIQQVEGEKDDALKPLIALGRQVREKMKAAKFGSDDTQATVELTTALDLDFTPLVMQLTGGKMTAAAERSVSVNNLKQMGLAMHNYLDSFGAFPAAVTLGKKGILLHSWRVQILPFVEQDVLYKKFKLNEPWDSEHNKKVFEENPMPKVFAIPGVTKPNEKVTHYQVFRGNGTMFDVLRAIKIQDITDGTSNTIMIATAKTATPWTKPEDIAYDPKKDPREQLLYTNDQTSLAFADGSVRTMSKKTPEATVKLLITIADGMVVGPIE